MKKIIYVFALLCGFAFLTSCGSDDGPSVDPIIGTWELFNVSSNVTESDFEYLEFSDRASLFGEDVYSIEFLADGTYERILEEVPLTGGSIGNIDDDGEWELDEDGDLFLEVDGTEIGGLSYEYSVAEITGSDLILEFSEAGSAFPQTKINEWFADGTIDGDGAFTVTDSEFDSLATNFSQNINTTFSLKFSK
ncbi:hypothetical protein [Ekhidna sp.]